MDLLDHDFHLFTEKGTGVRRAPATGRSDGLPFAL